jgi:8-oxo-dGTP pyrophosphatase MutT (NUDIX family)
MHSLVEPNEDFRQAAVRELREETGLVAAPEDLPDLGVHNYRPGKDLALFMYRLTKMSNLADLTRASTFASKGGQIRPEFDRFAALPGHEAELRVGKSLAAVLRGSRWSGRMPP